MRASALFLFFGTGFDDIAIGAPMLESSKSAGTAYVIFGSSKLPSALQVSSLTGPNGFSFTGVVNGDQAGFAVGKDFIDFNADGYADVVVSANQRSHLAISPSQVRTGSTYVIFGRCDDARIPAKITSSYLNGYFGLEIIGKTPGEQSGYALASAGDLTGAGSTSILIGSPYYGAAMNGAAYVVSGC